MYIPKQPKGKGICWLPSVVSLLYNIKINDIIYVTDKQQIICSIHALYNSRILKKIDFRKKNSKCTNIQHQIVVLNTIEDDDWKITDLYRKPMTTETCLMRVLQSLNMTCSRICWYEDKTCHQYIPKNANVCIVSKYFDSVYDIVLPNKSTIPNMFELTIHTDEHKHELHSVIINKKDDNWILLDCNYGKGIKISDLSLSDFSSSLCHLMQIQYNCTGSNLLYNNCKIKGYCFICTQLSLLNL
tara:strand:- start:3544 stop:4272 length:729 start_codon:yes stop_codon:yes gene_type:complete